MNRLQGLGIRGWGLGVAGLAFAASVGAQGSTQTLTLREAIALGQKQGYQASAAIKQRDAARAQDKRFGASLLPQLSLTSTLPQYNRSIIQVLQPDGSTLFKPQQQNQSSLSLRLAQKLPIVGGDMFITSGLSRLELIGARESRTWSSAPLTIGIQQNIFRSNTASWDAQSQNIRADVAERQYLEAREDIAIAVTNAFFDFYTAKINLANAMANGAIYDTLLILNKGRYEVGKIGPTDFEQSRLQYLRARAAVDNARLEYDRTLAGLRLQLRLPIGAGLDVAVPSDIPIVAADTMVAVAQALRNSSAIRGIDLQDVDSRRRVSEAKYNTGFGASISASVGFNQTGDQVGVVYRDLLQAQQYRIDISMPIWQWGARGAQIQAAKLDQERIESTGRQQREAAANEAHFAALQLGQTRRAFEIAAQADSVGAQLFDIATKRYIISKTTLQDFLQAQTAKDQAVTSYLQALRAYWTAYYRLRRLTLYDFEANAPIR